MAKQPQSSSIRDETLMETPAEAPVLPNPHHQEEQHTQIPISSSSSASSSWLGGSSHAHPSTPFFSFLSTVAKSWALPNKCAS